MKMKIGFLFVVDMELIMERLESIDFYYMIKRQPMLI